MPKQTKKPASRVVAGSAKKSKSSRSLTKRTALFGLVGIMALSVLAGLGWQKWQDHQLRAKAAGWSTLTSNPYGLVIGCKTSVSSAYGPLWKVSVYFVGTANKVMNDSFFITRGTTGISTVKATVYPGQWVYRETYASQILGDVWAAVVLDPSVQNGYSSNNKSFAEMTYC